MTTPPSSAAPTPPAAPPPSRGFPVPPFGLAAIVVSGVCTLWLGVEIVLRTEGAADWVVSASFVVALVLAAVVIVLAILAWRKDGHAGALWGALAIGMAASDRVLLALFTVLEGAGLA